MCYSGYMLYSRLIEGGPTHLTMMIQLASPHRLACSSHSLLWTGRIEPAAWSCLPWSRPSSWPICSAPSPPLCFDAMHTFLQIELKLWNGFAHYKQSQSMGTHRVKSVFKVVPRFNSRAQPRHTLQYFFCLFLLYHNPNPNPNIVYIKSDCDYAVFAPNWSQERQGLMT